MQLRLGCTLDVLLELFLCKRRFDPLLQKLVHLLRRPPNKTPRVQQCIQLALDAVKVWIPLDALDQVILPTLLLHDSCRLMREYLVEASKGKARATRQYMLRVLMKHVPCPGFDKICKN